MTGPIDEVFNIDDIKNLREGYDFEAKLAAGKDGDGGLPISVWDTYSAMANTNGGVIVLGLKERPDGSFTGLGINQPDKILRDFWNSINDKRKVSICLLNDNHVQVVNYKNGASLIVISVPRANRRSKPVYLNGNPLGNTFRRNNEGDYRCTDQEVRQMIADAEHDTHDDAILKNFTMQDFDKSSIAAYRNEFRSASPNHPWLSDDDRQLLINMSAWHIDRETKEEGPTLAGILMFGKWNSILAAIKHYDVDYRDRTGDAERWSDRVHPDGIWSGNLYDFYRKVYNKLVADLKMPFQIKDGRQRIAVTPVHEAIQEALVNALVHTDYSVSGGIVIEKLNDGFTFRNPGGLRLPKDQVMRGGRSDCRNQRLQLMFQHIGAGDKAGSGIPKILSAWTGQQWAKPTLDETVQPETVTLEMKMVSMFPEQTMVSLKAKLSDRLNGLSNNERLILAIAEYEGEVHNRRLQQTLNDLHPRAITDLLNGLVEQGLLLKDWNSSWTTYHVADLRAKSSLTATERPPTDTAPRQKKAVKPKTPGEITPGLFDLIAPQSKMPMPISEVVPENEIKRITPDIPVQHIVPDSQVLEEASQVLEQTRKNLEQPAKTLEQIREDLEELLRAPNLNRAQRRAAKEDAVLALASDFVSVNLLADLLNITPEAVRVTYINKLLKDGRLEAKYSKQMVRRGQAYRARRNPDQS